MCTPFELMNALGKSMFPRSSSLSSYQLDADGSEESKLVSSLLYELPSLSSRGSARVQAGIYKISRPPTTAPSSYEGTFNSVMVLRELLVKQREQHDGASECSQIVARLTSNECAAIRSLCVTLRLVCDDVESAVRSVFGDMSSVIDNAPSDIFELTVAMGSSSGVARLLHLDERLREVISDATTIVECRAEIYLYISDFITLLHDVCGTRLSSLCRHDLNDIINNRLNAGESAANYTGLLLQRSECINLLNAITSSDLYEGAYVQQLLVVDDDAYFSQVRPATRRERYITPVRSGDVIAAISNLGIYFDGMMMSMWGSHYETSLTWFLRFRNLLTAIIGSGDPLVVYAVLTHVYGPHHIVFTKLRDVNPSIVDAISRDVEADQTANHEFTRSAYKALDPQSVDPKQTSTASRCLRLWLMYQHHRFGQSTYSVGKFTDNIAEILPDEVSRRALDIGARKLESEYLEPMIQDLMRQCGLAGGWPIIKTPRGEDDVSEANILYTMEMCGFNMTLSELNAKYVNPHRKAGNINFININGSLYGSATNTTVQGAEEKKPPNDAGGNPEGVDMTWMDRLAIDFEEHNNNAPTITPNEETPTPTRGSARTRDEMDRDNRAKLADRERKKAERELKKQMKKDKKDKRQAERAADDAEREAKRRRKADEKQRKADEKQRKADEKQRKKAQNAEKNKNKAKSK